MKALWIGLVSLLLLGSVQAAPLPVCHVIYDAGSSGTRLYVYSRENGQWVAHAGPKIGALADPVREMRGKQHADLEAVTTEVVAALESIKQDGPVDAAGKPAWQGFDWAKRCRMRSASVLATAGMRVAEQENAEQSQLLWQSLRRKLRQALPAQVVVRARTLTGYEEGLFAWLSVRDATQRDDFGIVEMGGASSQVTFPCQHCDRQDDAVRSVRIGGKWRQMYSYSFLGLGLDDAPKSMGVSEACAYGVGLARPGWKQEDCAREIPLVDAVRGVRDPYNYAAGQKGTYRKVPVQQADDANWFLTGAFQYLVHADIEKSCQNKGKFFGEEGTACFRPVYLERYLQALPVPLSSARETSSWTLGALICQSTGCLPTRKPLLCRWLPQGCLH